MKRQMKSRESGCPLRFSSPALLSRSPSPIIDINIYYSVIRILNERQTALGTKEYEVQWARLGEQIFPPSWEPEINIVPKLIENWNYFKIIKDIYHPTSLEGFIIRFSRLLRT